MTKILRWGILSTGNIARLMVQDLLKSNHSDVVAVASRNEQKAQAFARAFNIPKYFGSYQSMCDCEDVDIVYVATPHSEHYLNTMTALEAGKHVLCEKPMMLDANEAKECFALAKKNNLFLMEALWMRLFPIIKTVKTIIDENQLGKPLHYAANFCIDVPFDPQHRLYNLKLGGGALMDLGIYPLALSQILFGKPSSVEGTAEVGETGVDYKNVIESTYRSGLTCNIRSSITNGEPQIAKIQCEQGNITICDCFFCPTKAIVEQNGCESKQINSPYDSNGYEYEIEEVEKCILRGDIQSHLWSAKDTIQNIKLMQQQLHAWGITYEKSKSG